MRNNSRGCVALENFPRTRLIPLPQLQQRTPYQLQTPANFGTQESTGSNYNSEPQNITHTMALNKGIDIKPSGDSKPVHKDPIDFNSGLSISPEERMAKTEKLLKRIDGMRASLKNNERMDVKKV